MKPSHLDGEREKRIGRPTHWRNLSRSLHDHIINVLCGGVIRFPTIRCVDRSRTMAQRGLPYNLLDKFPIDPNFFRKGIYIGRNVGRRRRPMNIVNHWVQDLVGRKAPNPRSVQGDKGQGCKRQLWKLFYDFMDTMKVDPPLICRGSTRASAGFVRKILRANCVPHLE